LPYTGGLYVYLREGWGRGAAFLFVWSELTLIRASAVGGIATVFSEYFLRSIGRSPADHPGAVHYLAAAAILFAALVNIRGVHWGAALVGFTTVGKIVALLGLVGASLLLGRAHGGSLDHFYSGGTIRPGLFGLALISVLWAYDGWADLSFVAGEVKDPGKTLPRALIGGTLAVICIYLLSNVAYLFVNPIEKMAHSRLIAADTAAALFGNIGAAMVSVLVMVSTFSALNAAMLVAPRVFFAAAEDRLFFSGLARVHPRFQTPHIAIGLAGALGVSFVLTRTFEQLADTFVIVIWPFYALSVAALYRLQRPEQARKPRQGAFLVLPLVFIGGVVYLVANAFLTDPLWTGVVFGVVLAGLPVYWMMLRRN
jgi:amino acid transporter